MFYDNVMHSLRAQHYKFTLPQPPMWVMCVCVCVCVTIYARRWLCGARMRLSPRTKSLFEAHSSRHPRRRRRCLWRWWRGGGMVGIGVGVGIWETRCGGGWGAWQEAAPPSGCRASRDWRCVCVCVCGVYWSWLLKPWRLIPQVVVAALGMNGHGIEYHWQ